MANNGLDKLTDLDSEKALVGSLVIDPDAIYKVAEALQPDDFHDERCRDVFQAVYALYSEQASIDWLTITRRLNPETSALVGQLLEVTPTAMHVRKYAQIVSRLGTLRRLMGVAGQIAKLAYSTDGELGAVFEKARLLVDSAAPVGDDASVLLWLDSLERFIGEQLDRLSEIDAVEAGETARWAVFPWKAVQQYVSRLRPGMLGIIAAASNIGKTAFLECCAEYWARKGLRVLFFHAELSHQLMMDRRMTRISGEPYREIEAGMINERTDKATAELRRWPGGITYIHCPGWTAQRITNKARQLWARTTCDVVIMDYLQKIRLVPVRGQNSADWIGNAVETLKVFSEQTAVPVLIASQLSQAGKAMGRKTALGIRGSGAPENKSNLVITLDRDTLEYDATDERGQVIAKPGDRSPIIKGRVDKNTTGPTGDFFLVFNGARILILDEAKGTPRVEA